ncbi:demethylmenaquinone methyltransferase/2-methoxy-6-polyprenyl-1,4-benzoquinol methylase [Nocardia transvalensis]|uniref:Demethylmenaquinone methyltransferase/2-methoxy-6-polyprenyl-1,4-benzoquinol methylase n=1 Tax=Nocardia transvalensis TaxID=37333 RepID=A0A7W9PG59_9NOCA|nr:class I SAM-dependent methyltransferase [Nocardia transvalensis]MBB5914984.1 demethylmenaquinone methyltransferase/2-methoxy-6-polyprenyl-1,4-benzoquinol methylase [Nocardia transvalensis]
MSRNIQLFPVIVPDEAGLLITSPRRYNVLTAALLGGRHRRLVAELTTASGAGKGSRVIDIGSGPGKLAAALAVAVGPGGAVLGIDPSGPMVEYATARTRGPNVRFEVGTAQSIPVGDSEFDVLTCTFVMHHVAAEARDRALAEMYRVLRPGGTLLLADAHPDGPMRAVVGLMGRFSRRGSRGDRADAEAPRDPFAEVDVRRYADSLVAAGFEQPVFRVSRYATGILTARKPGPIHSNA